MYKIRSLTEADARQIVAWRYPAPYNVYDMAPEDAPPGVVEEAVASLLDPANQCFAVEDEDGSLLGFCSFGADGQVPGYDYDSLDALDLGAGMHPDKVGQGRSRAFLQAILDFGREQYHPTHFRVTIARFNARSRRMCERAGFVHEATFTGPNPPGLVFDVLVRPAFPEK